MCVLFCVVANHPNSLSHTTQAELSVEWGSQVLWGNKTFAKRLWNRLAIQSCWHVGGTRSLEPRVQTLREVWRQGGTLRKTTVTFWEGSGCVSRWEGVLGWGLGGSWREGVGAHGEHCWWGQGSLMHCEVREKKQVVRIQVSQDCSPVQNSPELLPSSKQPV